MTRRQLIFTIHTPCFPQYAEGFAGELEFYEFMGALQSFIFEKEFKGMVVEPATVSDLMDTAERLVSWLRTEMTEGERRFILSVKKGKPEWSLLGLPGIEHLPAVQWKLQNIRRMKPTKHREAVQRLRDCLGIKG